MRDRICSMICSTLTESDRTLKSAIDNHDDRHAPQQDACEQRAILQNQLGGAAARFLLMDEVQVTKDPVNRKRDREPEPFRSELLNGFGVDGVEDVGNQR